MLSSEVLARSPLLANLPPESLNALASAARRRTYRRGEVIFHQGDPGDSLHFLTEGRVKVVLDAETGEEAVIAILGPGDCFGELALIDGEPRSATVETLEAVQTLSLSRNDFMAFIRANPQAAERMLVALAGMVRRADESMADLVFLDLEGPPRQEAARAGRRARPRRRRRHRDRAADDPGRPGRDDRRHPRQRQQAARLVRRSRGDPATRAPHRHLRSGPPAPPHQLTRACLHPPNVEQAAVGCRLPAASDGVCPGATPVQQLRRDPARACRSRRGRSARPPSICWSAPDHPQRSCPSGTVLTTGPVGPGVSRMLTPPPPVSATFTCSPTGLAACHGCAAAARSRLAGRSGCASSARRPRRRHLGLTAPAGDVTPEAGAQRTGRAAAARRRRPGRRQVAFGTPRRRRGVPNTIGVGAAQAAARPPGSATPAMIAPTWI